MGQKRYRDVHTENEIMLASCGKILFGYELAVLTETDILWGKNLRTTWCTNTQRFLAPVA